MPKFKKKPVIVEAIQWNGDNLDEVDKFIGNPHDWFYNKNSRKVLTIRTFEGYTDADLHDWIIKGTAGEFYPCKPDIFKEIYESVK